MRQCTTTKNRLRETDYESVFGNFHFLVIYLFIYHKFLAPPQRLTILILLLIVTVLGTGCFRIFRSLDQGRIDQAGFDPIFHREESKKMRRVRKRQLGRSRYLLQ